MIGLVIKLFHGQDGEQRVVELPVGKDKLERAIQHLYLLELSYDSDEQSDGKLNVNAQVF